MTGGRDAVGSGVREKDKGTGNFIPGEAEGLDIVQGVQGRDGARVSGGTHADTEWEGSGGETALGSHSPQGGTVDIQDSLHYCRGIAELSS